MWIDILFILRFLEGLGGFPSINHIEFAIRI